MAASRKTRQGFRTNEYVVYPAHGVGRIKDIEEEEIGGIKLELFVIDFEQEKMVLRVPTAKAAAVGMRKLADPAGMDRALRILRGRARIKRTMWSRRAQEYEAKINSGDILLVAEVVRDLYRSEQQPEQSYSERQLFEAALDRMGREVAAVRKVTHTEAIDLIQHELKNGIGRGDKKPAAEDDSAKDAGDDTATDTAKDTGDDTATDTAKDAGDDSGKDTAKDAGDDTAKDTGDDTAKDAGKTEQAA